jgi:hypothetical protein
VLPRGGECTDVCVGTTFRFTLPLLCIRHRVVPVRLASTILGHRADPEPLTASASDKAIIDRLDDVALLLPGKMARRSPTRPLINGARSRPDPRSLHASD